MGKQWAIRMREQGSADVDPGLPNWVPGAQVAKLEIADLRTETVGRFTFVGPEWGAGAPVGFDEPAPGDAGWTYFKTTNDMTLADFAEGHARIYGGSIGMGVSVGWGGVVFQQADIDQSWWRGDGIDLGVGAGRGISFGIGWSPGDVRLDSTEQVETDFSTAVKALDHFDNLVTSIADGLGGPDGAFAGVMPIAAVTGALHDFHAQVNNAVAEMRMSGGGPDPITYPQPDAAGHDRTHDTQYATTTAHDQALDHVQTHVITEICEPRHQDMTIDPTPDVNISLPPPVTTPPPADLPPPTPPSP